MSENHEEAGAGLQFVRHFSQSHVSPYDQITWKKLDARLTSPGGEVKFELKDVEVPASWSERATNIVAEKYFRVVDGVKETSVRQMISRVVRTIAQAGLDQGLFTPDNAAIFSDELAAILLAQRFAFNSPVWFNIGVPGVKQQASACFIQNVDDNMESITDLIRKEILLFKGGSGTGSNFSKLRSSYESLSGGGEASGPVSFMEVLDAGAGVTKSGGTTRRAAKMAVLNIDHPDILIQKNGRPGFIACKSTAEKMAHDLIDMGYEGNFTTPGNAYEKVGFQNANNSVRVTDAYMTAVRVDGKWQTRSVTDSKPVHTYSARELWNKLVGAAWFCGDPGLQFDSTTNRWHTCPNSGRINASNPCSEYLFLDDTACNLGSFNLVKFYEGSYFQVDDFAAACKICITAMEILVGYSSYPSDVITENSRNFRPLGIGYANLGALLMRMGLAYDSAEGRQVAAAITALMSGVSYAQSAHMARVVGPFPRYAINRTPMLHVIDKHREAAFHLPSEQYQYIITVAQGYWNAAQEMGLRYGFRNSQISVLAPTGTIGFMMDCDTTGIEPSLGLVTHKKLVGGGYITMPNNSVKSALEALDYPKRSVALLLECIEKTGELPPAVPSEDRYRGVFTEAHRKVFQTAVGKDPISVEGHLLMMSAVQPFLSGGISKTVNLPATATVDDVSNTYMRAWELGLKCVAIYRDGCKRSQPVSAKKEEKVLGAPPMDETAAVSRETNARFVDAVMALKKDDVAWGTRKRLPEERQSVTHKFSIGGQEGYLHVGMYPDGKPGEVFINIAKAGSTLHGFSDMFATAVSIGLQYGVPVDVFVDKLMGSKFEPAGFTTHENIRTASSIGDYLAKWLERKFLTKPTEEVAVSPQSAMAEVTLSGDTCSSCGNPTQVAGTCRVCIACGTTTGCG